MRTFKPAITLNRTALGFVLFLVWLGSWCQSVSAAPLSSKRAAAAVTRWLEEDRAPLGERLGGSVQRVDAFKDKEGSELYYVVYLDPSGFVIVSADDLVEPIIAFSKAGTFDPSTANPLGALVSGDLPARLAIAHLAGAAPPAKSAAAAANAKWQALASDDSGATVRPKGLQLVSDVRIAPLTQTTWSQQTAADAGAAACYNYYTPPYGEGSTANYPAGCVATAMAQLMRYYQFPTTSVGTAAFPIQVNGSAQTYNLRGGDGSGGAYIWANMPLVPPASPTPAQCQAIGALVADAGATVKMNYGAGGSSSILLDAKTALTNTFHFSRVIKGWNNNNPLDLAATLTAMLNPNLDARYPSLLSIRGPSGGHAVIADGYGYSASTLYHHLNLGWSGTDSAWYTLPTIDTSAYLFNVVDGCLYNVFTNGSGEIISGRVLDQIARPVAGATVTATRTSGGVYTTTTDTNGIYALAKIPSSSSYSVTITKPDFSTVSGNFSTGGSWDMTATCGNYWGANFTMNMLPTAVDHLVWSAIAATQTLNTPFGITVTAQNATNGVATGFNGTVALSGYATGLGSGGTLIGNLSPTAGRHSASGLTHAYAFTPSANLQVTAVRAYTGDKVSIWTDGGTVLASQNISSSGSWVEAALATPITLSAGTPYRVGARYGANIVGWFTTAWPTTFANGAVGQNFYTTYGDAFPAQVYATGEGPLVDLRYVVVLSNAIPVVPSVSGAFVNGIWSGNITLSQAATNVVLQADDGAGHTATSNPFTVTEANAPLLLSCPQRSNGQFQCTASGQCGQRFEIQVSTNLLSWSTLCTLTNSSGSTNFTDSSAGLSRRFYRGHVLP